MNCMASTDDFVANSNWVPFLWKRVPGQGIM